MKTVTLFLASVFCFVNVFLEAVQVDSHYPTIIEKILFYKKGPFSVYYGGPIERAHGGVQWMMSCTFEDDFYQTRAVYEMAFVNCNLTNCEDAEVLYVDVSDVNIKFKNKLCKDYQQFSHLLNGKYSHAKYVVIRATDVASVFYPNNYVQSEYGELKDSDKKMIIDFLHNEFHTKNSIQDLHKGSVKEKEEVDYETNIEISYKPKQLEIDLQGKVEKFFLVKKILKNDEWKVYYLITKKILDPKTIDFAIASPLVRIDSGCVSGQIYDDDSCDCLDQLHSGLYQIAQESGENSLIIHIPMHDGRGYGTAPKCETEIYKHGGKGRVHTTKPLNTVKSAKLLYSDGIYDIRTYEGAAVILKEMGFKRVSLLTDNIVKVESLKKHDIEVVRMKTGTQKVTCLNHIKSKKNSELYYKE